MVDQNISLLNRKIAKQQFRWMILEKGYTKAFNNLPADQRRVCIPRSEDDFFISLNLFSPPLFRIFQEITIRGVSCVEYEGKLYPSLNEVIKSGALVSDDQHKAIELKEKLSKVYLKLKIANNEV